MKNEEKAKEKSSYLSQDGPYVEWLTTEGEIDSKSVSSYKSYRKYFKNPDFIEDLKLNVFKNNLNVLELIEKIEKNDKEHSAATLSKLKDAMDIILMVKKREKEFNIKNNKINIKKVKKGGKSYSPKTINNARSGLNKYFEYLCKDYKGPVSDGYDELKPYITSAFQQVIENCIKEKVIEDIFVQRLRTQNRFGANENDIYFPISTISCICTKKSDCSNRYDTSLSNYIRKLAEETKFRTIEDETQLFCIKEIEFISFNDNKVFVKLNNVERKRTLARWTIVEDGKSPDDPMQASWLRDITIDHQAAIANILRKERKNCKQLAFITDEWKKGEKKNPKKNKKEIGSLLTDSEEFLSKIDVKELIEEVKQINEKCEGFYLMGGSDNFRKNDK